MWSEAVLQYSLYTTRLSWTPGQHCWPSHQEGGESTKTYMCPGQLGGARAVRPTGLRRPSEPKHLRAGLWWVPMCRTCPRQGRVRSPCWRPEKTAVKVLEALAQIRKLNNNNTKTKLFWAIKTKGPCTHIPENLAQHVLHRLVSSSSWHVSEITQVLITHSVPGPELRIHTTSKSTYHYYWHFKDAEICPAEELSYFPKLPELSWRAV